MATLPAFRTKREYERYTRQVPELAPPGAGRFTPPPPIATGVPGGGYGAAPPPRTPAPEKPTITGGLPVQAPPEDAEGGVTFEQMLGQVATRVAGEYEAPSTFDPTAEFTAGREGITGQMSNLLENIDAYYARKGQRGSPAHRAAMERAKMGEAGLVGQLSLDIKRTEGERAEEAKRGSLESDIMRLRGLGGTYQALQEWEQTASFEDIENMAQKIVYGGEGDIDYQDEPWNPSYGRGGAGGGGYPPFGAIAGRPAVSPRPKTPAYM